MGWASLQELRSLRKEPQRDTLVLNIDSMIRDNEGHSNRFPTNMDKNNISENHTKLFL